MTNGFSPQHSGERLLRGKRSNVSKHSLMLSAAVGALLAGPAFATTATCTPSPSTTNPDCITTSTTTALTTSTTTSIYIAGSRTTTSGTTTTTTSAGSISVSKADGGAITVNSNSYVYSDGLIKNSDASNASGILVDLSANRDASSFLFTNNSATTTITGAGIYMDSTSSINLSGSGTGKHGIWLNGAGTYTGAITFVSGSTVSISGDTSDALLIDPNAILNGDLSLGGTITVSQTTAASRTDSNLYGLLMKGEVNGNISLPSGGTMTIYGKGATGMSIQGTGVIGSISIGGTLATAGESSSAIASSRAYSNTNTSNIVYPESGSALVVAASVGQGIAILGPSYSGSSIAAASVTNASTYLTPTIVIDPAKYTTPTASLVIGVYSDSYDPGFGFYNRGTITETQVNQNESTEVVDIVGYVGYVDNPTTPTVTHPTIIDGGIYNSGGISTSAVTNGKTAAANSAIAINIGSYVYVGGSYDSGTSTYTADGYACTVTGTCTGTGDVYGGGGAGVKIGGDQAALVNTNATGSGTISATVSGTRGGTAVAIEIASNSHLSSILNSGTIAALASTTDTTLDGLTSGHPLQATAIQDKSGSLTYIFNSGTISAAATTLDNDKQQAIAIDLSADTSSLMDTYSGVTIISKSTSSSAAKIVGDILFGAGNNQQIIVLGTGSGFTSTITGNIHFGTSLLANSGDLLSIGSYGIVSGKITADSGIDVMIANNGTLNLENDTVALNATGLTVSGGGTLNIGVNGNSNLGSTGIIDASGNASNVVTIANGANLNVAYASFMPQGADRFVLITAPTGNLTVTDLAYYSNRIGTPIASGGTMPFLFHSASLSEEPVGATDELVLNVTPKDATALGLTTGSYAVMPMPIKGGTAITGCTATTCTLFDLANAALANDNTLGAAMINGIHNTAEAQKAYDAFAPDVTGGTRAIAISITDQATGMVGARLRMLNLYGKQDGGTTLWGQEFFQMIKDPGRGATDPNTGAKVKSGFRDHGFGFVLGMDGGTPRKGWYGGAFTFYEGDVNELARDAHQNQLWYLLSGYSAWRGKGLFFDSKIDAGYGHINGKRFINLQTGTSTTYTREAETNHTALMLSGGFTAGGVFSYGATTLLPQISLDGLLMSEAGYTEKNPGTIAPCTITSWNNTGKCDGFDLKVGSHTAKSLRAFVGASVRYDLDLWNFYLQPEAHAGYRYDFFNDPTKLKAAFAYADTTSSSTPAKPGSQFTITGPDPAQGNIVLGGSLSTTTSAWTLGFSFDFLRGSNGALEEVGTVNLLGRI